jgi:uncharacterized membrane protein YfcA
MDPRSAIILIGYWGIFMNFTNLIKYRTYIEKAYIKPVISGGLPGVILGSLLIAVIVLRSLEIALGIFILVFATYKFHNKLKIKNTVPSCTELGNCAVPLNLDDIQHENQKKYLPAKYLVPGGFAYALLGSLIGASGPISVIMLQSSGFEKERFVANFAACSIFLTIIKLIMYTALGLFPIENILLLIAGYFIIYISAKIGHKIAKNISATKFELIVLCILVIMGVNFIL